GELRLAYAQFEELETFSRFASRLDEDTRATIERGRRVREVLKQNESAPLSVGMQLVALRAVVDGLLDHVPLDEVVGAEHSIRGAAAKAHPEILARIDSGAAISAEQWDALAQTTRGALAAD
ncbi:MAG: F0F1 ATP synthase subunit alpha, partial [Anaerolineae bacterium]|nr:F0F1 ATP synthase subunit alpha [Anaerolineae bacterium]